MPLCRKKYPPTQTLALKNMQAKKLSCKESGQKDRMESGCGHTAGLLIEALNPLAVQQIDSRARTVYAITAVRATHNYDYEPFHGLSLTSETISNLVL